MSDPHNKQSHLRRKDIDSGKLERIQFNPQTGYPASARPSPAEPTQPRRAAAGRQGPPSSPRQGVATLAALMLILAAMISYTPSVQSAYINAQGHLIEGFENTTFPFPPTSDFYTYSVEAAVGSAGSSIISSDGSPPGSPTPEEGDQTLRNSLTSGSGTFSTFFDLDANLCLDPNGPGGTGGRQIDISFYTNALGNTRIALENEDATDLLQVFIVNPTAGAGDQVAFNNNGGGSTVSALGTDFFPHSTWHRIGFACSDTTATITYYNYASQTTLSLLSGTFIPTRLTIESSTTAGSAVWVDRINFGSPPDNFPDLDSNQVAVSNLVGYSMDAGGNVIIVRTSGGASVSTYNTNDISTPIATTATATCARPDVVLSTILTNPDNGQQEIWTTYGDCDGSGDVDALRIRDGNLGTPTFPNDCQGEPTENVENNADVDVPNNMQQMGTIADLAFDFRECINPAGLGRGAFASWTFSSSFDGWIGAFGVGYGQDAGGFDEETSHEEHATPPLDQSVGAKIVDAFCSWVAPDFKDYIAGVSSNGAAGIYEVQREIDLNEGEPGFWGDIDFTFVQKFRNTGTYGNSNGIDCAQDKVVISTLGGIRVLQNITTTPSAAPGWPIVQAGITERPVAITGSAEYIAIASTSGIRIYNVNGTQTGFHGLPTGTFRGMEFSHSGDKLAVFTSTLITVISSGESTCELDASCEELGGATDDDPNPTSTSTPTSGPGGEGIGPGELLGSPYFWILVWILIINVIIAALSWGTRAGFGGSVYLVATMIVYIIGMIGYGTAQVSPWPLVAVVVAIIGLAIGGYIRR